MISEGAATLDLAIEEVADAPRKKVAGEMGEGTAIRIVSDLLKREAMVVAGQDEYLLEAFRIATRRKVTVYDALFIALAKSMKAELVTSDKRQYEASLEEGVKSQLV